MKLAGGQASTSALRSSYPRAGPRARGSCESFPLGIFVEAVLWAPPADVTEARGCRLAGSGGAALGVSPWGGLGNRFAGQSGRQSFCST